VDGEIHTDSLPQGWGVVEAGPPRRVKQGGHGWYIESDEPSDNKTLVDGEPATVLARAGGYRRKDAEGKWMEFGGEEFWVYRPLHSKLMKFFPSKSLDQYVIDAANCQTERMLGMLCSHPVAVSTIKFFLHQIERLTTQTTGSSSYATRVMNNANFIAMADMGRISAMASLGVHQDVFQPMQVLPVDSDLKFDWAVRPDVRVVSARGVVYTDGSPVLPGALLTHLRFNGPERVTWRRTRFFQLVGRDTAPLDEHAPSNLNYSLALFRLLKSEVGDDIRRNNAIVLGDILCDKLSRGGMKKDVVRVGNMLRGGRNTTPVSDQTSGAHQFIASNITKLTSRVTRGW